MKRTILTVLASLVLATLVFANSHPNLERGHVPGSMMRLSGPDSVNLFNGNLSLSIPLGQTYPVSDTLSYSFGLRYNSNIWDFTEGWDGEVVVQAHPASFSNAGTGWRLSLGDLLAPGDWYNTGNPAAAWVYLAPDGSSHRFYSSLHRGEASGGRWYTRDGSYLRMHIVASDDADEPIEIDIEMPSGNVHTFETGPFDRWYLKRIEDRFGNFVAVAYTFPLRAGGQGMIWTVTDSAGRSQSLDFSRYEMTSPVPRYRLDTMSLAAFNGNQACFIFEYVEQEIPRSYKHTDSAMGDSVVVPLLQTVIFPDGSSNPCGFGGCSDCTTTDFTYVLTGDPAGMLESMRLPTGGSIDWQYGLYTFPQGNVSCDDQGEPWNHAIMGESTGVTRRRIFGESVVPDGAWWYSVGDYLRYGSRSVKSPDGTRVDSFFNTGVELCSDQGDWRGWAYGLPFLPENLADSGGISKQVFAPDAHILDPPIRRISVDYDHDQLPTYTSGVSPQSFHNSNRRLVERNTVYENDVVAGNPHHETIVHSDFDGLGHYRTTTYSGDFWGENAIETFKGFNPDLGGEYRQYSVSSYDNSLTGDYVPFPASEPWIINTFDVEVTRDLATAEENRAEYCYDLSAEGHPTTGFLEGVRVHANETAIAGAVATGRSSDDIIKRFAESSVPPGRVDSERLFGAEVQAVPTSSSFSACEVDGLVATFRMTYDYASGVLSSSSFIEEEETPTPNPFFVTLFSKTIDPNTGLTAAESDTSGFSTVYSYDLLGRLTEAVPENGAKTVLTYTPASGSGAGLVKATVHQESIDPDTVGTALTESKFTFDAFGRGEKESHLLADGSWNQRISSYDALDRLEWITEWQPDGTTPENYSKTVNSDFDAFGRVGIVTLPDGHQITYEYTGRRLVGRTATVGTTFNGIDAVTETNTTTTTTLDRQGRPIKVEEPSGAGGLMVPTIYRYDVAGNLKTYIPHIVGEITRELTGPRSNGIEDALGYIKETENLVL